MNRPVALLIVIAGALLTGSVGAVGRGAPAPASQQTPEPTPEEQQAMKDKDLSVRAGIERRIAELQRDAARGDLYLPHAQERVMLCTYCHGENGNSANPDIPSLAGQSAVFLVDQLDRFADGRRQDYWMSGLAHILTEDEKIDLALYYAAQSADAAGGGNPKLMEKGRQLYEQFCVECHGVDAKAKDGYARLAGQQPGYMVKMLKDLKDGTGPRYNPWMAAVANMLGSDESMLAVATYVASLP